MNHTFLHAILVLAVCFAVLTFALQDGSGTSIEAMPMTDIASDDSIRSIPSEDSIEDDDEYVAALDKYWIASDHTKFEDFEIDRRCDSTGSYEDCFLTISRKGKPLRTVDIQDGSKNWLKYGLFDFLGNGRKQLIVHTYSGGAHCCYEYEIFDLGTRFRSIYTSAIYDPANQIGNQLVPVDIDGDGVFEFHQDVMAFDYMGIFSHATSSFPPAIFAFDEKAHRYKLATKQFPEFVLKKLKENIDQLERWKKDAEKNGTRINQDEIDEIKVRETFLYWVYAGKREDAWQNFEQHYRSETGDKYQDRFREKFIRDFKELFAADPTYKSIYGNNKR